MKWLKTLSPVQIIVWGFLILILLGAILLCMPFSSASGNSTDFIDSLFTSTSAVCITGLTTLSTFSHWSAIGKVIIIILIQIGGLGFMTMVTFVFMALRKKITFRERTILQESLNLNQRNGMIRFVRYILFFTLFVEGIGAVLMFFVFKQKYSLLQSIYYSIFHSISAYCNAGFDILGDTSLSEYAENPYFSLTVMALIVTGGLGFAVWSEIIGAIKNMYKNRFSFSYLTKKLSLHSKLAIIITVILIFGGGIFFFITEFNNPDTIGNFSLLGKLTAALFQSVTLRTAGFYSINQDNLHQGSKLVCILLMAIGGSPAGTAGGIKTVTIGIIILAVISVIKGKDSVSAFGRSINMYTLQKALAVTTMIFTFIVVGTLILTFTEYDAGIEFIDLLFENVSAIGTVGLTTGITPELTNIGKLIIIIEMFLGRLGPITVAIAISSRKKDTENLIHYPQEDIMVG